MKTPRSKPQAASFGEEGDFVLIGGTGAQTGNSLAHYDASLGAFRNNRRIPIKMVGHCVRKVNDTMHIVATKNKKTYLFNTNNLTFRKVADRRYTSDTAACGVVYSEENGPELVAIHLGKKKTAIYNINNSKYLFKLSLLLIL